MTKLFVATPMYGGQCHGLYVNSCLQLQSLAARNDIEICFSFKIGESLLSRARNELVNEFLQTDYTHFLFIDSDIMFNPQDVLGLIEIDKLFIGAPYPLKKINWQRIINAVKKYPDIKSENLTRVSSEYVFDFIEKPETVNMNEPLLVKEIGTGFMLIKRDVFTGMIESYPSIKYTEQGKTLYAFFDSMILDDRYLSEDYTFCSRWRKMGGEIYICPWMVAKHCGSYIYG